MCGNKTHGIYQNRYRKATLSSLGDMMTRTYANKNNRAVLKQEMKTCNITKTFPRADIRARCQLLKTTVTDSAVAAQHRGSCAETDCVREGRTRLGGRRMKNHIFRKLPQKVRNPHRRVKLGTRNALHLKDELPTFHTEFTGTLVCQ